MKVLLASAAIALSTAPLWAQTGVSHPDNTPIIVDNDDSAQPPAATAKPSPAVPYTPPSPAAHPAAAAPALAPLPPVQPPATQAKAYDPDANIVLTDAPDEDQNDSASSSHSFRSAHPTLAQRVSDDPDAEIVTSVPMPAGEMPEGTLLRARLNRTITTRNTLRGTEFEATLSQDVQREGRVIVPAGSILQGVVTEVRDGRRIAGRAAIHLEPQRILLPDGSYYVIHAQVIDTGEPNHVRVDREGTILHRSDPGKTLAAVSLATGSSAVAGAMLGGGVGALVGAGIGAGASTILWLKQDREASLPKETMLIFSLTSPMKMHPLRDGAQLHLRP